MLTNTTQNRIILGVVKIANGDILKKDNKLILKRNK